MARAMPREGIQGDEWTAYLTLGRTTRTYHGIAYRARAPGRRRANSSRGSNAPRGARESREQGEVAQVTWTARTKRYAECRTPKRCWVSYVSAAGVACRYNGCIDNCSTRSSI